MGPKWVIRCYRLHEVAERLSDGKAVNLAELALDLGYFDQAHFIKDFKTIVGVTPADYARGCQTSGCQNRSSGNVVTLKARLRSISQ